MSGKCKDVRQSTRPWLRRELLALAVGLALVLAGCARNAPQDTLKPAGTNADKIMGLYRPVFWVAAAVFVLVQGLALIFVLRFRQRPGDEGPEPPQVHGNSRLELGWTIVPAVILAVVAVPTVATIFSLNKSPGPKALNVEVVAHQFWWEYRYTDPEVGITTANELHIPAGRPSRLIENGKPANGNIDVIHSFWVPKLSGKTDNVPGRVSRVTLQSDKPGTYLGQCAEFCGLSHANMRLRVIVDTPADFATWVAGQRRNQAVAPPTGTPEEAGRLLFAAKGCSGCHTVNGYSQGQVGPDLTHLYSRQTFAGGIFDMSPDNLRKWLKNPPLEKPGVKMPNLNLTDAEISQLLAYLQTLQ